MLLFSIIIYLNDCNLKKYNKQEDKYRVSREKILHRILNIFLSFPTMQFTVGKPELITI